LAGGQLDLQQQTLAARALLGLLRIVAEILNALGESGSYTGFVASDEEVCTEILVERSVSQHVEGSRQHNEAATAMAAFFGSRRAFRRKNFAW
jgi:hypothetical protein